MPMNIVIQEQRKLLGLTQEQVADYLGVSTPAVSKWEKGMGVRIWDRRRDSIS